MVDERDAGDGGAEGEATARAPSRDALRKRASRLARGRRAEDEARDWSRRVSLQGLIAKPLLEAIDELGGEARPEEVYRRVAARLGLSEATLAEARTTEGGRSYAVYQHQVRWARQTAVAEGTIGRRERGLWTLTDKGRERLERAGDGAVVLAYRLDDGFALWARAEDAAGAIEPGSVKLVTTSPPYPQIEREYGRHGLREWLVWMTGLLGAWKSLVARGGTIALNLGDVHVGGTPCLSPYVERLVLAAVDGVGLHLASRVMWLSPSRLGHIEWSLKRRVTPANRLEHVVLLTPEAFPDWDTRRLEAPKPSARSVARRARDGEREQGRRPSGRLFRTGAFVGDPAPGNLIVSGGASGGDGYSRACRRAGVPAHPARFPEALPRYVIGLATRPGETVYDPMAGSNTTGMVASAMGRRFVASEALKGYVEASALRFGGRADLELAGGFRDLRVPDAARGAA